jgi:DNA-binding Lrp family transcriptional regulator
MVVAGVLIKTAPGKEKSALESIRKIEGVTRALGVFGRYDIVVMLQAKDLDEAMETVLSKIRTTEGVIDTETLIAANI